MNWRLLTLALLAALGCNKTEDEVDLVAFDDQDGLLGEGLMNPYPNPWLMVDGKVTIPVDDLPPASVVNPSGDFPVERVEYRTGFSPVTPILLRLPDVSCEACPKWKNPTPGEGAVLLADLTTMEFLPVFAELDAYEDAVDPTLIIRPQIAMAYDHDIAVVVTTEAMGRPDTFQSFVDGTADSVHREHFSDLIADLGELGVDEADIALAWDFPVGDGTTPLRSAISQVSAPGTWDFQFVRNADAGDDVPANTWRSAYGRFDTQGFLIDGALDLNEDGTVNEAGTNDAMLVAIIPDSVVDAAPGTVPVMLYGHGLLSSPQIDLYDNGGWAPHELANELGMIVIATSWGGLDAEELLVAVSVANDFAQMPKLTGAMIQGQANTRALVQLITDGDLLTDPVFQGAAGQQLADVDSVYYWGISMGGILGGVAMSQNPEIEAGVLHVGGGAWSTLLERSRNWTQFEFMVLNSVPKAEDRQTYYALSQLFWDAVDPLAYADDLKSRTILLQESFGDDSVNNITTRMLARSIELPLLTPSVDGVYSLDQVPADLPPGSRALAQFDSERGAPPNKNRPADSSGAHDVTVGWDETRWQAGDFLNPATTGAVIHYCGTEACTNSTRN